MKITTNHQCRPTLMWYDLTTKEKKEFDYIEEEDQSSMLFVRYKGWVYDVGDFMRVPAEDGTANDYNHMGGWDGYQSDSAFSGVLIRWTDSCGDYVVMGTYTC